MPAIYTLLATALAHQAKPIVTTKFVLIETDHPGNVGAAARAIKTMGFDDGLILVDPRDPKVLNRRKTMHGASGAGDVLSKAHVANSLEEAVAGTNVWCATGMPTDMSRERRPRTYQTPREYFEELLSNAHKEQTKDGPAEIRISFLFGNERRGMREEEMDQAHVLLGIPTNPAFGSLNLASAVQLIAYDWRQAIGGFDR